MTEQTNKIETLLKKPDMRQHRAYRFAHEIVHILDEFLPASGSYRREVLDHLFDVAHRANLQVISVPNEWDALTQVQIECEMLKTHPMWIEENGNAAEKA